MKFSIDAFKITLSTDKGIYGTLLTFKDGLNVIRAENTSGKTTIINGILYALGLEVLIGKKGIESLKPVLWNRGDYNGDVFSIIESYVELEITNSKKKTITLRRIIRGNKDNRLVEVISTRLLTKQEKDHYIVNSYFVGVDGAAQRENGFHFFLADFLQLELPFVKRFKGEDVPLYIECIAPLLFIEQIRGWSGIQASLNQSYGIRNVAKLAIEYILKFDVLNNEKLSSKIIEEANDIKENWKINRNILMEIATEIGGRLINVPDNPVTILADEPWICIEDSTNKTTSSLQDYIYQQRELLFEKALDYNVKKPDEELILKLEHFEKEFFILQAEIKQVTHDIYYEESEIERLKDRMNFVSSDIQRNKDIRRLREYGVDANFAIVKDICPTCNQSIKDSLIPTTSSVMTIDENINYLKTEEEAIRLLLNACIERVERFKSFKERKQIEEAKLRSLIKDLKKDLVSNSNISINEMREQIILESEIEQFEKLNNKFEDRIDYLKKIAEHWRDNRLKLKELPDEYFSALDKKKLKLLTKYFSDNLLTFGYRSTNITGLHISQDNYRPICDDFEISYGASASDNIRIIWAYTLALLQVSIDNKCNHWGIIIYDEPEQQKMKETSSDSLYKTISEINSKNCQVILATSASADLTRERLSNIPHHLLNFDDKIIRPIN